jgi:hypothetical protein
MENKCKKNRRSYTAGIILACTLFLSLLGCVYLDRVSVKQTLDDGTEVAYAEAGTEATFTIEGHIQCAEDHNDVQFVAAILVPKSWNAKKNASATYVTNIHTSPSETLSMSVIPESSLPKNGGGRTWSEALMQEYGVGPNALRDMEWVVFQTDRKWLILNNDNATYTIKIKCNVGEQNMKARIGFFINHTDDGFSSGGDHKKVTFSEECFEVINGKGLVIDFCNPHFFRVQPLAALQDDFVTFSFLGGVGENDLASLDEIYYEATAYTRNGGVLTISEKSNKTQMKREAPDSKTFDITIWPRDFFGVADNDEIERIEYVFTDRSGHITVTQSDDDIINEIEVEDEKVPFSIEFKCN